MQTTDFILLCLSWYCRLSSFSYQLTRNHKLILLLLYLQWPFLKYRTHLNHLHNLISRKEFIGDSYRTEGFRIFLNGTENLTPPGHWSGNDQKLLSHQMANQVSCIKWIFWPQSNCQWPEIHTLKTKTISTKNPGQQIIKLRERYSLSLSHVFLFLK